MRRTKAGPDLLAKFEGITQVVDDSLRFKRKLAIGEDAYTSLKIGRAISQVRDVGAASAAGAAIAASPAVAATFFGSSGLLSAIGLGAVAATPVGWIAAAAAATGGAYYGVTRAMDRYTKSRVEVIPRFINSPIDQLGAAILDMMGALALKVANIDGAIDPAERLAMIDYFVEEWGYDPAYAASALSALEESALDHPLKAMTAAIGKFVSEHPDCNLAAFRKELILLLREVAEADGRLDEREELAIDAISEGIRA